MTPVPWSHIVTIVFAVGTRAIAVSYPQYLGCFVKDGRNTSPYINVSPMPLSNVKCSDECLSKNYTFAALNKTHCRCSNNYFSQLMKVTDDDCDVSCAQVNSSDPWQTHFKMFKTQNTSEEHYPEAIYVGCYISQNHIEMDLNIRLFDDSNYISQMCSEICFENGYLYSATIHLLNLRFNTDVYLRVFNRFNSFCMCNNQYPSSRFKRENSMCDDFFLNDDKLDYNKELVTSIFATGIVGYPLGVYVGCFKQDQNNIKPPYEIRFLDARNCFYICNHKGYKYAMIIERGCQCSNEKLSEDNQMEQDDCRKCFSNRLDYCGSSIFVSVYENSWFGKVSGNLSMDYFGCFESSHIYPVMDGWIVSYPYGLTSQKCVTDCYTRGFPYAAFVSKNECLCSFDSPSVDAVTEIHRCAGLDSDVAIGREGDSHVRYYRVFATGLLTAREAGDRYWGCYSERAMHGKINVSDITNVTPKLCSRRCAADSYQTYGLSSGETCWCVEEHSVANASLRLDDSICSMPCNSDINKYCGGWSAIALFSTGAIADVIRECSTTCDCHFLPKYNVSRINCSNRNLTKLTETILNILRPLSSVELILRDNSIQVQPDVKSLKIVLLDISNNSLKTLNSNLLPNSLKYLFIDNNHLTTLNDVALESMPNLIGLRLSQNPWSCETPKTRFSINLYKKIEDIGLVKCSNSNVFEKDWTTYLYAFVILSLILFVCFLFVYLDFHKMDNADSMATYIQRTQYEELEKATDNWNPNNILGKGGFGIVYKGVWKHTEVAIKRLTSEGMALNVVNLYTLGDEQLHPFKEIMYLNAVKHDNILCIYGFCLYSTGSCLIYQYMPNGSLEDRLQRKNGTTPLSWALRGNITMGTARGLQFLHNAETPLIHGDIKSANILLDANFEPRIGDFGLARTGPLDHSNNKNIGFDVSRVCGTRPYLPDDFCANKKLSTKVDTYSFGVVMFEIATGLRAFNKLEGPRFLKNLVNQHDQFSLSELADKFAGKESFHVFEALVHLGKLCVAEKAELRPEMVQVYENLQNVMSSNGCVRQDTENNEKINKSLMKSQDTETTGLPQNTKQVDWIKLKGRKAARLAPLHEIPSISMLYSNSVCENDPRKNLTAVAQCSHQNVLDNDFLTTNF